MSMSHAHASHPILLPSLTVNKTQQAGVCGRRKCHVQEWGKVREEVHGRHKNGKIQGKGKGVERLGGEEMLYVSVEQGSA